MMRERSEQGYVLLGIAIGLVIMGIFMAAAVPAWEYVIQREKEEELLWRGRQYVKALERYQRKYPGAFPSDIDVLVKEKFLRKVYEDPMSSEGEWRILRQNSPELRSPAAPGASEGQQAMPGRDPRFRAPQPFRSPQPIGRPSGLGLQSMSDQQLGGVVGVASTSDKETIRVPGRKEAAYLRTVGEGEKYNEWLFVFQVAQDPTQLGRGGPGQPGGPGQGPRGQPGRRGFPGGGPGGPGGFNTPNAPRSPSQPTPPGARRP